MNKALTLVAKGILGAYNFLIPGEKYTENDDAELTEIRQFARKRTDISDHLATLYKEALAVQPKVIVELGVRTGASTFALSRAAEKTDAWLISLDMEPTVFHSDYEKWRFILADDIEFAKFFPEFADKTGFDPPIDFLFIDTSHTYDHTRTEIEAWLPYLGPAGTMIFHDTNMKTIFRRKDGSLGGGWNNKRGVIRAVQEFLQADWDESHEYQGMHNGFSVHHIPTCSGLTILRQKSGA
ncbi:MAG: class I SAM-dependent methyltransferase [Acidobacteria bacterium]|nr:class I SAM-dependent methyltransferase [Acidobacteriota bacterium]